MAHIIPDRASPATSPAMAVFLLTKCRSFSIYAIFPKLCESCSVACHEVMGKHHADFHGDVTGIS